MERVIIVGAGKIGFHLAKALSVSGYDVAIIEQDKDRGAQVAESLEIKVFYGNGTNLGILQDAGTAGVSYFVAVTGSDADNIVACQIAKENFHVPQTIARVIDPGNEKLFRMLGIDAVISTTALAAKTIQNVLPSNGLRLTSIFDKGDVELAEVELSTTAPVVGHLVSEITLPGECLLIAILRNDEISFPRGKTLLEPNDTIFALTKRTATQALRKNLLG
ncbi:MAG: NAD-binding protein [Spirochaetaceae bacterium]|nr:NAD-binding protein [Spirochaetaceae bacterium]